MLIIDLFLLKPSPYFHACQNPKAPFWVTGFLISVGILYGVLVAVFQRQFGGELQGIPVDQIPNWILFGGNIASGILIIVIAHAGVTIVAWMMARAVGGPGGLIGIYRVCAYLLPLAIPALPLIALTSALSAEQLSSLHFKTTYLPIGFLGTALFLAGLYQAFRVTQDVTPLRATGAVALFTLFCVALFLIT